jgi:AcrR family transcriptional regulator
MAGRQAAAEATRDAILHAAHELFLGRWYDDVTLAAIASGAGVSGQTVINHFGGKEQVFAAVIDRFGQDVVDRRYSVEPGDVAGAIEVLVDDYELTGDSVIRLLALEDRLPVLGPALARGRRGHRAWVETMFAAPAIVDELVVATDVYAWKLLRRDRGMSRDETAAAIRRIVDALLTTERTRRSG